MHCHNCKLYSYRGTEFLHCKTLCDFIWHIIYEFNLVVTITVVHTAKLFLNLRFLALKWKLFTPYGKQIATMSDYSFLRNKNSSYWHRIKTTELKLLLQCIYLQTEMNMNIILESIIFGMTFQFTNHSWKIALELPLHHIWFHTTISSPSLDILTFLAEIRTTLRMITSWIIGQIQVFTYSDLGLPSIAWYWFPSSFVWF